MLMYCYTRIFQLLSDNDCIIKIRIVLDFENVNKCPHAIYPGGMSVMELDDFLSWAFLMKYDCIP